MTIYYTTHNAAGGGTGLSLSSPMTIYEAEDIATAGDEIRLCNTGTYALTGTNTWIFDNTVNLGSITNPIRIFGYDATGTTEETSTISGENMTVGNYDLVSFSVNSCLRFKNIRFTQAKRYGINVPSATSYFFFENCRFDHCVNHGVNISASACFFETTKCLFDNNGGSGYYTGGSGGKGTHSFDIFYKNTGYGCYCSGAASSGTPKPIFNNCFFVKNVSHGIGFINNTSYPYFMINNCTSVSNGGSGLITGASIAQQNIQNSIFANNGGYGINFGGLTIMEYITLCQKNCCYGNATGHTDINGGVLPGTGHKYLNPNFVNMADDFEDYTPQETGLLISEDTGMGIDYNYIGAIQPQIKATLLLKLG